MPLWVNLTSHARFMIYPRQSVPRSIPVSFIFLSLSRCLLKMSWSVKEKERACACSAINACAFSVDCVSQKYKDHETQTPISDLYVPATNDTQRFYLLVRPKDTGYTTLFANLPFYLTIQRRVFICVGYVCMI